MVDGGAKIARCANGAEHKNAGNQPNGDTGQGGSFLAAGAGAGRFLLGVRFTTSRSWCWVPLMSGLSPC